MPGESRTMLLEALREKAKSKKVRLLISGALLVLPAFMSAYADTGQWCGGYSNCIDKGQHNRIWCQSEANSCSYLSGHYHEYNTVYELFYCYDNHPNYVACNMCLSTVHIGCCSDTAGNIICQ